MISCFLLLSCFSWFVVVNTSKNNPVQKELTSSLKFEPKFLDLVRESFDKDLPKLFKNKPNFSDKMERYIYDIYKNIFDKKKKWSFILRRVCVDRNIFGEKLNHVTEFIPIGLSRILKAERVDINKLFKSKPAAHLWTREVDNVAQVSCLNNSIG